MEPSIDLYGVVLILGAAHGLFLALALLNAKRGNTTGHRLLALLTLLFSIDLGFEFLDQSRYMASIPLLLVPDLNIDFLFGPLTYLYVRSLTDREGFTLTSRQWLHLLPFTLGLLLLSPLLKLDQPQLISLVYANGTEQIPSILWAETSIFLVGMTSIVQMAAYLLISIRKLIRHRHTLQDEFSFLERISLTWLRNLLIALAILYLLYVAEIFFVATFDLNEAVIAIHYPMIVIVIYIMGYMGLRQPAIFTHSVKGTGKPEAAIESHVTQSRGVREGRKYERSALDSETSTLLFRELQAHMIQEAPHLDNKLSLSQLAEQLGISANYLSQVINAQAEQHFFDFINSYRIDAAKQALTKTSTEKGNILAIALDAGFNSKSAFYTAFKRHTGQTPSQYRNRNKIPDSLS
ncbi:MAG: AraC family transcriptional regulator [Candidatus Thiodiazotropha sp. (ex Monitilora ramsayi)]|nr:AraC family transcriptional regulator [Candidatus Thiodiazotropha sp. (ex Monitilora ramsayi)]